MVRVYRHLGGADVIQGGEQDATPLSILKLTLGSMVWVVTATGRVSRRWGSVWGIGSSILFVQTDAVVMEWGSHGLGGFGHYLQGSGGDHEEGLPHSKEDPASTPMPAVHHPHTRDGPEEELKEEESQHAGRNVLPSVAQQVEQGEEGVEQVPFDPLNVPFGQWEALSLIHI